MKKILLLAILFTAIAILGATLYSTFAYRTPRSYEAQTVIIPPHAGVRGVIGQLHQAGLTPSLPVIAIPLVFSGQHKALKAGEYAFEANLSPAQIIAKIIRGDIVVHKLTVPEGWNSFQVRAALMAEPLLTGDLPAIAEGSVFPDTIHFSRNEPRAAVLARMQRAREAVLNELWNARAPDLPIATPEEALILASIVEKETGVVDEREKVAAVFINRLRIGMRLQTDPSVVYGIEAAQGGAPMGRALSSADLQADTPYNSYTRDGLPPTPICNPGRASIAAALHPASITALYFVATGHGGHNFADTLQGHEQNVTDYRKAIRPAVEEVKTPVVSKPKRRKK